MNQEFQQEQYMEMIKTLNETVIPEKAQEDQTCRICLQGDTSGPLITPCQCAGTVRYVHEECLKAWLLSKGTVNEAKCELCHSLFRMEYKLGKRCAPCALFNYEQPVSIIFTFLLVLVFVLALVIGLLVMRYLTGELDHMQKMYLLVILGLCCLLGVILLSNLFQLGWKNCLKSYLVYWTIKNQHIMETGPFAESECIQNVREFEVPQNVEFDGVKIETPALTILSERRTRDSSHQVAPVFVFTPQASEQSENFVFESP